MTDAPNQDNPGHEMPPMGQGILSWGLAGFFLLPLALIALVFLAPMCAPEVSTDGTPPMAKPTPEIKEN